MPIGLNVRTARVSTEFLPWDSLPAQSDVMAREILALFREADSSANPFYGALTFYKTIERLVPPKDRGAWMDSAWPKLSEARSIARYQELILTEPNVGTYIQKSVRQAIAHTNYNPFVNPDDGVDRVRITRDLPLLRDLTLVCIKEKCVLEQGKAPMDGDLSAFLRLQTPEFRDGVATNDLSKVSNVMLPDELIFAVRRGGQVVALNGLIPTHAATSETSVVVRLRTLTDSHALTLCFDFSSNDIALTSHERNLRNAGTRESLTEEITIFSASWLHTLNGWIEVWDGPNCIGTGKPFFPMNAMANPNWALQEATRLGTELSRLDLM